MCCKLSAPVASTLAFLGFLLETSYNLIISRLSLSSSQDISPSAAVSVGVTTATCLTRQRSSPIVVWVSPYRVVPILLS
jgi:hypothetical protein